MIFLRVTQATCGRALSCNNMTFWRFGRHLSIALLTLCNCSQYSSAVTVALVGSISQWITPWISHHTLSKTFEGWSSLLEVGSGIWPGDSHCLFLLGLMYRHHFSSPVMTWFSQSNLLDRDRREVQMFTRSSKLCWVCMWHPTAKFADFTKCVEMPLNSVLRPDKCRC